MKPKFRIIFYHGIAWFQPIDLYTVSWMEAKGAFLITWIRLTGFAFRLFRG